MMLVMPWASLLIKAKTRPISERTTGKMKVREDGDPRLAFPLLSSWCIPSPAGLAAEQWPCFVLGAEVLATRGTATQDPIMDICCS